jgi:predicted transcriptional regulator
VTITPEQCKEARDLLGWSRGRLACQVGASEGAVRRYEDGGAIAATLNLMTVREILETAGAIFAEEDGEGPGVRLRKSNAK